MKFDKFKEVLSENQLWPSDYTLRFIIPFTELKELERILGKDGISTRPSKNGNYITVIFTKFFNSPEDVIVIYKKVSLIKGIISL